MRVSAATLRDFRNYARAEIELGERLTVVAGPNGAGKTNLLEALYFGCTAPLSPNRKRQRARAARGEDRSRRGLDGRADGSEHLLEVGFTPGEQRTLKVDGAAVDSLSTEPTRPLVSVFMPDRLELVKGAPSGRRAHLDHLVGALWPARANTRAAYSRALAQRNALLGGIRAATASRGSLDSWDAQVAREGAQLMADRAQAIALLAPRFTGRASELGLPEEAGLAYRPRSAAGDAEGLLEELRARHAADIERGFTAHGPHRDDVRLVHGAEALRTYGSQGQQRVALLALLFAERDLLRDERGRPPLMLLDDVMSELDPVRRELLADLVRSEGQSVMTTTDLEHVPGVRDERVKVLGVTAGVVDGRASEQPTAAGRAA